MVGRSTRVYVMASNIKNPPVFGEKSDYDVWKRDIALWQKVTDVKNEMQAIVIHLSLSGKARQIYSELTETELEGADGVKTLMGKLDRVFSQDINWKCFNAYLAFEEYRREPDVKIDDYLCEFDRRYHKLTECKVTLPSAIIACRLLKSCNLSDVQFQLALSTTTEMNFEAMRETLKKLFTDIGGRAIIGNGAEMCNVKCEPAEAFYGAAARPGAGVAGAEAATSGVLEAATTAAGVDEGLTLRTTLGMCQSVSSVVLSRIGHEIATPSSGIAAPMLRVNHTTISGKVENKMRN